MEKTFFKNDWLKEAEKHRCGVVKQFAYTLARPWLSRSNRRHLSPSLLSAHKPSLVLGARGIPVEFRRKWAIRRTPIQDATILIQGTGTGWEVLTWAPLKPHAIIATDLFDFQDSWSEIKQYVEGRYRVQTEFRQAPLEDHSFLPDGSIDLCASDAVFEHCQDLPSVLRESFRVLKPGGVLYASYGPMWYAACGDHFSGRGGSDTVYNHLLLDADAYRRYFQEHLASEEDFQSGGRYVELDLFSKLTTDQYVRYFTDAGFLVDEIILIVSVPGIEFKERNPDRFGQLVEKYAGICVPDDFLIVGNCVRLLKP